MLVWGRYSPCAPQLDGCAAFCQVRAGRSIPLRERGIEVTVCSPPAAPKCAPKSAARMKESQIRPLLRVVCKTVVAGLAHLILILPARALPNLAVLK